MQDQEFTSDQDSENTENQASEFTSPETENLPNFTVENADLPEQETVVFSQPVENPSTEQFEVPVQTVSSADTVEDEELFGRYEIKSWDFSPRLYKIFAFSAIFNILFIVAVAQTNILRAKACDSPLVGGFCQVLDTLYVGGKILSSDSEFAEKGYEPTEIENAEIVWLDKTGIEPPLDYPAGYFQIANPEMFQTVDPLMNPDTSGFPTVVNPSPMSPNPTTNNPVISTPNTSGVFNKKQRLPKTNNNAIPKNLPDGIVIPEDTNSTTDNADTAKNNPKKNPKDDKNVSKQPDIKSEIIKDFRPNKTPLKDLAKDVLKMRRDEKNNFDLSKNFTIVMNAVLTEEGKFDPKKTTYDTEKSTGDERMRNIAKRAMEKIGDSQIFYYLKGIGVDKINFVLEQNDNELRAVVTTVLPSKMRANTVSTLFSSYKDFAVQNIKADDKDLHVLLKGIEGNPVEKNFVITFNLDKPTVQAMIKEQLDKAEKSEAEEKIQKPNGNAQTVNTKEKTGK